MRSKKIALIAAGTLVAITTGAGLYVLAQPKTHYFLRAAKALSEHQSADFTFTAKPNKKAVVDSNEILPEVNITGNYNIDVTNEDAGFTVDIDFSDSFITQLTGIGHHKQIPNIDVVVYDEVIYVDSKTMFAYEASEAFMGNSETIPKEKLDGYVKVFDFKDIKDNSYLYNKDKISIQNDITKVVENELKALDGKHFTKNGDYIFLDLTFAEYLDIVYKVKTMSLKEDLSLTESDREFVQNNLVNSQNIDKGLLNLFKEITIKFGYGKKVGDYKLIIDIPAKVASDQLKAMGIDLKPDETLYLITAESTAKKPEIVKKPSPIYDKAEFLDKFVPLPSYSENESTFSSNESIADLEQQLADEGYTQEEIDNVIDEIDVADEIDTYEGDY